MNNTQPYLFTLSNRFLVVLLAVIGLLLVTNAVYADNVVAKVSAPNQFIELERDGERLFFSAEFVVFEDGTAEGEIFLGDSMVVAVESGSAEYDDEGWGTITVVGAYMGDDGNPAGQITIEVQHSERSSGINGILIDVMSIGPEDTSGNGRSGGGGEIILVDIVGPISVQGTLDLMAP